MELTAEQVHLVRLWEKTEANLRLYKQTEQQLRQQIINEVFDPTRTEGTENILLGAGYKLICVKKENYSLRGTGEEIASAAAELPEGTLRWKPELSVSTYKLLTPDEKAQLNPVLEIKPGMPSLELKAPKDKEKDKEK